MDFAIQLVVVLICLFYGARKGGIALGLLGGIGLVLLVFVFHLKPGKPPVDVMLVIIAVVAASATLQASGGLDVMLQIAERLLRRNPKYVSIVAPFVTCLPGKADGGQYNRLPDGDNRQPGVGCGGLPGRHAGGCDHQRQTSELC